jgi:hypothetical protein
MGAAVEVAVRLDAVSDDLHSAVLAGGGEGMYGALKAVEGVRGSTGHRDFEGLIIIVATHFALGHVYHPLQMGSSTGINLREPMVSSGKGLHIFLRGKLAGSNIASPIETSAKPKGSEFGF